MKQTNTAGFERTATIPAGYQRQVVLAESLHKTYGGSAALHGLSFTLTWLLVLQRWLRRRNIEVF